MNESPSELRCAIASLQAREEGAYPAKETLEHTAAELAYQAEERFRAWLNALPSHMQSDAENQTVMLANAWADKAYERGCIAGARMMIQLLVR